MGGRKGGRKGGREGGREGWVHSCVHVHSVCVARERLGKSYDINIQCAHLLTCMETDTGSLLSGGGHTHFRVTLPSYR